MSGSRGWRGRDEVAGGSLKGQEVPGLSGQQLVKVEVGVTSSWRGKSLMEAVDRWGRSLLVLTDSMTTLCDGPPCGSYLLTRTL